jgi:hypothetical protein
MQSYFLFLYVLYFEYLLICSMHTKMASNKYRRYSEEMVLLTILLLANCSPVCRQTSKRVTPSSSFYPVGQQRDEHIATYKQRVSKLPCRFFEASKAKARRHCPFLNNCQFGHIVDGEQYSFSHKDIRRAKNARRKSPYGLSKDLLTADQIPPDEPLKL